jgi:hypothetical protein
MGCDRGTDVAVHDGGAFPNRHTRNFLRFGDACDRGPAPQAATQGSVAERSSPVVLSYRLFDGVPVGVPPPPREAVSEASRHYLPVEWTVRLVGEGLGSYLEFSLAW